LKTRWQAHPLQALVEAITESQALKTRWQNHMLQQALVELITKTSFEYSMARSPAPGFGRTKSQNLSFEDSMANAPVPGFG